MSSPEPALALWFAVRCDGLDAIAFSACEGLNAEREVEEVKEGGNNEYVHRFPGRMKYQNIKLTRAVDDKSGQIAHWFSDGRRGGTAKVEVRDGNNKVVATWSLRDTWPVKYTGPQLNAATNGVATEVLELVHHGFTMGSGG